MASDIFSVEPPRWLQAIAKPIDTSLTARGIALALATPSLASERTEAWAQDASKAGQPPTKWQKAGHWFQDLPKAMGEAQLNLMDPFWRIKAQKAQLDMMSTALGMARHKQILDMNRLKLTNEAKDLDSIPAWLEEHPTPESRLNATWPSGLTPAWRATLNQLRSTDTRSIQMRSALDNSHAYQRRLDSLAKEGPDGEEAASGLRAIPMPDTGPTPEMLMELSRQEQSVAQRKRATAAQGTALGEADVAAGRAQRRVQTDSSGKTTVTYVPGEPRDLARDISSYRSRLTALSKQGPAGAQAAARLGAQPLDPATGPTPEQLQALSQEESTVAQSKFDAVARATEQGEADVKAGRAMRRTEVDPVTGREKTIYVPLTARPLGDPNTPPKDFDLPDGRKVVWAWNGRLWQAFKTDRMGNAQKPPTFSELQHRAEYLHGQAILGAAADPGKAHAYQLEAEGIEKFLKSVEGRTMYGAPPPSATPTPPGLSGVPTNSPAGGRGAEWEMGPDGVMRRVK